MNSSFNIEMEKAESLWFSCLNYKGKMNLSERDRERSLLYESEVSAGVLL